MSRYIPDTFINDLLLRVDIVDVIDARVPLRKSGANFSARCPFHQEKTPSFTVSPSKQFYHCFGCGKHGNAIQFLMEFNRLSFVEAVEQLAAMMGLSIPYTQSSKKESLENQQRTLSLYELMDKAQQFYTQTLLRTPHAMKYLQQQRGLSRAILEEFKLGYAPPGWSALKESLGGVSQEVQQNLIQCGLLIRNEENKIYDRFRHRIMFPILDRKGRITGFGGRVLEEGQPKYLNSPESPIYHKGTGDLYGLYHLLNRNQGKEIPYILVVEGYMDLISLAQQGLLLVVATLGTATTRQHLEKLFRYTKKLIFCFDGDTAGRQAAWRALENVLPLMKEGHQAFFLFLPEGEDPDTIIRQEGIHNFNLRLEKAKSLSDFLFQELRLKLDLKTIDGRAALSEAAIPLLQKIPPGSYQQLMTEELGRQVRIDNQKIHTLLNTEAASKEGTLSKKIPKKILPRLNPMERAMSYALQYPAMAYGVPFSLPPTEESSSSLNSLFSSLMEFIQENPSANTAMILQHWQGSPHEPILNELALREHILPFTAMEQEFKEILKNLWKYSIESEIEILMGKASQSTLNHEEKLRLQGLIAASKEPSREPS